MVYPEHGYYSFFFINFYIKSKSVSVLQRANPCNKSGVKTLQKCQCYAA
jgi:hypothetical protein